MNFREYQQKARRTQNPRLTPRELLEHATWGLTSEVGEITGMLQKKFQGHVINMPAMRKEIGDALWFLSEMADVYKFDLDAIAQENIEKLRRRYPDGFSEARSVNREE